MQNKDNIHVLTRAVIIDKDHILLCKTLDLAVGFYFLPGGHIEHGESAQDALLRELIEETGAICSIKRLLGCLEYSFSPGHNSICHNHEYNFVFEVESDLLKLDYKVPQLESHISLVWMPLEHLTEIDFRAEPLKMLISRWLHDDSYNKFYSSMV